MRWRAPALPRDTRDTLFLLALIAWTVAPHLSRQPPWMAAICGGVLCWRGLLAWRQGPLPGRAMVLLVLVAVTGLTFWSQRTWLGREAGVMLLVALMTLKTLELRARRDAMVLFFLGFFLVLTHFLYSQSLLTALAMGLSVWGWLTALTLAHMPAGRPTLREAGGLAARAALIGTPVMVALFLLFPRVAPLWALPSDSPRSGLSDQLRLGDVAELAQDDSVALRLRFDGPPLPARQLYLRGPVLSDYDGQRWQAHVDPLAAPGGPATPATGLRTEGPGVAYEMTLEPLRLPWLPLLETTPAAPGGLPPAAQATLRGDAAGQWRLRSPLGERVRLRAVAWPDAQRDLDLPPALRRESLRLPARLHPGTRAWARALREQPALREADPRGLAEAVLQHIRSEPFRYTLAPGRDEGDPLDRFWLERRAGFCEHYAAAFVVIMRTLGVPARIVTGYQGGDAQLAEGYLVVRQSHAHAWAEIWQPGAGWWRVDPTGAVAPERIEKSSALRPPAGLVMGTLDAVDPGLRLTLRRWAETLENRWNQSVLGYGRQQQFGLLESLGWSDPDLSTLGQALAVLLALAALGGATWAWHDGRRRSPWQRLQALIARELARLDVAGSAHDDPGALARAVRQRHGEAGEPVAQALLALQARRYGRPTVGPAPRPRDAWGDWPAQFRRACAALRAGAAPRR